MFVIYFLYAFFSCLRIHNTTRITLGACKIGVKNTMGPHLRPGRKCGPITLICTPGDNIFFFFPLAPPEKTAATNFSFQPDWIIYLFFILIYFFILFTSLFICIFLIFLSFFFFVFLFLLRLIIFYAPSMYPALTLTLTLRKR